MRALISENTSLAKVCRGGRSGLGVGVLGVEVGDGVGLVLVAQPLVVVDEHVVVEDAFDRAPVGDRRRADVDVVVDFPVGFAVEVGHSATLSAGLGAVPGEPARPRLRTELDSSVARAMAT